MIDGTTCSPSTRYHIDMMKSPETSNGSNSTSGSASAVMEIARSSSASNTSTPNTSVTSMSDEQHTISKYSNFRGSGESIDALRAMKEVLEVILKNDIQGPQLFRLDSEFDLELGKGTQFKVTGASRQFRDNIRLMRKSEEVGVSQEEGSLWRMLDDLANSVVKRALWTPDLSNRQFLVEAHGKQLSQQDMTRELESQLRSAQKEIDKLCNKAYKRHPNIVRLKGWGLCLDTFEANTTLNTRIPLLILEKATCDLADFLASSNYNKTSFESLIKICSDIGTGLGALHAGNVTHGDMKPENILLFASGSLKPLETVWTAKLCDFGNAESRSSEVSAGIERFSAAGMYSSTSHAPEKAIYAGTPGWIPPEAFPDKGNFKSFDFESLKRCDVFVYGLIVWRIFQDESDRGVYDIITKRRRSNRVHLVDGERISEYLPPHDLAYQNAAKDIKRATRIERRRTDPSGILFTQRSRNIGMGRIPTSNDMWRILKVLRAALQPTPKYRDSRPWQFFDGTYYSTIQPFLESPILDEEASWTYKTLMHNLNKAVALGSKVSRQFSRSQKLASSMLQSPIVSTYGYLRLRMSSVVEKPQRHRAFETLFKAESSRLPLGWDIENLSELEHVGENCYPFPSIFSTMKDLYEQTAQEYNSKVTHQLYACARLRSRFKDCCWQSWSRYLRKFNAVALLLCCVNYTEDEYEVKRLRAIKLLVYHSNSYFPIIAWMCRGKIGQRELREIANSEQFSSRLWSWTHDREIPLELRNDLFKLFIESGCYVGPAFGRYLEGIVERSITIHTNYEYIINACAKVIQYSQIASGSEPGSNLMDVDIATRRFFLRGESPDQSEDNISKAVISNLHGYNTSTILHEAVIAFCYPAVEYLVQCSAIPFLVRNRDRKTPLELAYDIKGRNLVSWKLTQINAIIGILSKETRVQHSQHELPLGWEMVQVESGITVFRESTVNPTNPSLTFQTPKFSLLQETQIPLGSRKSDQGGLTYNFDLVRFMHRPKLDQLKHATKAFGDAWYKDESKNRIETLRIGMDDSHERISWVRFLVQLYKVMKVVLLRSYINALLIFLPISLLLTSEDQQNLTSLLISFLAAIPLIGGLESAVKDFHPISPNFMEQSVSSRSVSCIAEALVSLAPTVQMTLLDIY